MHAYGMSDPDVKGFKRAIVPVGSMEQHGPHLPLLTDALIAEHVAGLVAEKIGAVAMPAITYGVSYEHAPLFHASVKSSTLAAMVCDICESLADYGFTDIILLNGHHGNIGALQYISQELKGKVVDNVSVQTLHYWHAMKDELGHAGETETSLVLAIAPRLVRMERARPGAKKPDKSNAAYSTLANAPGSFIKITGNGVWGDPRKASAEKGRKLLKEITAGLSKTISEL